MKAGGTHSGGPHLGSAKLGSPNELLKLGGHSQGSPN